MRWIRNRCRREDICLLAAGALSDEEKIDLERHLAGCQECRDYYGEIKSLTAPLAGWEKSLSAVEVTREARLRWAGAVQGIGAPVAIRQPLPQNVWQIIWRELIWPSRYAWGGMAALWAAMLVVNVQLSGPGSNAVSASVSSPQEMMQAWREQNRVLAELAQPVLVFSVPPSDVLPPRSQRESDREIL
jgi:anti-sigma factor RsiW